MKFEIFKFNHANQGSKEIKEPLSQKVYLLHQLKKDKKKQLFSDDS